LDKPPPAAENCSAKLPVGAPAGTVNVTSWALPAAIVIGVDGDEVTPAGRPDNDIATGPENPFIAAADTTDGGLVVPEMAVRADGPTEKVKSGGGGGVGVFVPPPQPTSSVMRIAIPRTATAREAIRVTASFSPSRVERFYISRNYPATARLISVCAAYRSFVETSITLIFQSNRCEPNRKNSKFECKGLP
jgi:hypothetical protein